jgi:hypothetical protein
MEKLLSLSFCVQPESCIGYGHWVISTLMDVARQDTEIFQYAIKEMAAIPAAADALTRYTGWFQFSYTPCIDIHYFSVSKQQQKST